MTSRIISRISQLYRCHSKTTSFLLALASLAGVLVVSISDAQTQTDSNGQLPAALNACIPSVQVAQVSLVSKARSDGVDYYLLSAKELNDTQGTDLIISLTGSRCHQVFYNPMGDPIPLAESVEQGIARQLTLGRYRRELNKIGREAFQRQINSAADTEKQVVWWDEQVWALQQLGLKVPTNVVVE